MAEKTINTKIALKLKTLSEWAQDTNANYVPLKGEVCLCEIPSGDSTATTAPTILFKVGDGTKTFSALNWVSALAADVYNWAKAATKPEYTAAEVGAATAVDITKAIQALDVSDTAVSGKYVSAVNEVDGKVVITRADLPTLTDTDTQYQLTFADGVLKLQSKAKGGSWADVSGQSFTFATGTANGTIAVNGKNVAVKGLGTAAYKAAEDFTLAADFTAYKNTNNTAISNLETAVKSGITFKGKVEDFPASPENGWLVIKGTKEYIYSTDTSTWVELGDEGSHLTKAMADTYYVAKGTLGTAAEKNISTSLAATGTNLPTEKAVADYIAAKGYTTNTGTVKSVAAGEGLKITGTATTTPTVEIDEDVVFVLNCNY